MVGTATHWPEYLLYNLETEDGEVKQDIKNAAVPYNNVGLLEVKWVPLAGPEEADEGTTRQYLALRTDYSSDKDDDDDAAADDDMIMILVIMLMMLMLRMTWAH